MKKFRKIMAVALAVLMCFCTLSTVFASAVTETQATEQSKEYNDAERDFSAYMCNVSEKKAEMTATSLNTALAALLSKLDIKSVIYTDAVATTIVRAIADLFNNSISNSMSSSGIASEYPEVYEYLFETCGSDWANVDNSQVKWGITPGDREAFTKAIAYGTTNFGTTIIFAATMGAWFGYPDIYGEALAPLIESLHVGKLDTFQDALTNATASGDQYVGLMSYIFSKVCDAIDMLAANPVNYVCDVLPDFANSYSSAADVIGNLLGVLGVSMQLPDFNGIIASVGEKLGLTLTEVDVDALISMGVASAAESAMADGYRMQINGNKAVVFMALAGYVKETAANKDNQVALAKLVVEKAGVEYETFETMLEAAKKGDIMLFVASMLEAVEQATSKDDSSAAVSGFAGFIAKLMKFVIQIRDFFRNLIDSIFGKI